MISRRPSCGPGGIQYDSLDDGGLAPIASEGEIVAASTLPGVGVTSRITVPGENGGRE
jgi:hypothetical protein